MVLPQNVTVVPRLVVTSAGRWQNMAWPLDRSRVVVGRGDTADVRLDDPAISRTHALIDRSDGSTYVVDLGSSGGTLVNGLDARSPVELRNGDVVSFASIQMRFDANPGPVASYAPPVAQTQFTAGQQYAQQLNNVGGDQYQQYIQTVYAQRESFLREIAAGRTRARRLIWFGLLLFLAGGGTFTWMVIRFIARVDDESLDETGLSHVWGEEVGGVPVGFIGFAVAAAGSMLMFIGIILHVVATSRRRRVESQPLYPPGPGFPPTIGR